MLNHSPNRRAVFLCPYRSRVYNAVPRCFCTRGVEKINLNLFVQKVGSRALYTREGWYGESGAKKSLLLPYKIHFNLRYICVNSLKHQIL